MQYTAGVHRSGSSGNIEFLSVLTKLYLLLTTICIAWFYVGARAVLWFVRSTEWWKNMCNEVERWGDFGRLGLIEWKFYMSKFVFYDSMYDLFCDEITIFHNELAKRHTEYCHSPERTRKLEVSIMEQLYYLGNSKITN